MAQVHSLMPEEPPRRQYAAGGYAPSIWGTPSDEPSAAPLSMGPPAWSRKSGPMLGGFVATPVASRSSSSVSQASLPGAPSILSGLVDASPQAATVPSAPIGLGIPSVGPVSNPIPATTGGSPVASVSGSACGIDDELIFTAIVVKNISFAIKKEQLLEVMNQMGLPQPYAFNYHFDNGVFRGLAFANFATPEETGLVIARLNGREVGGRKLRVEYKKMLPAHERERIEREKRERRGQLEEQHLTGSPPQATPLAAQPALDFNDQETLDIYSSLLLFQGDRSRPEITLGQATPAQTRTVQLLCSKLQLRCNVHETKGVTISKAAFVAPEYPSALFRSPAPDLWAAPSFSRLYGAAGVMGQLDSRQE